MDVVFGGLAPLLIEKVVDAGDGIVVQRRRHRGQGNVRIAVKGTGCARRGFPGWVRNDAAAGPPSLTDWNGVSTLHAGAT